MKSLTACEALPQGRICGECVRCFGSSFKFAFAGVHLPISGNPYGKLPPCLQIEYFLALVVENVIGHVHRQETGDIFDARFEGLDPQFP